MKFKLFFVFVLFLVLSCAQAVKDVSPIIWHKGTLTILEKDIRCCVSKWKLDTGLRVDFRSFELCSLDESIYNVEWCIRESIDTTIIEGLVLRKTIYIKINEKIFKYIWWEPTIE